MPVILNHICLGKNYEANLSWNENQYVFDLAKIDKIGFSKAKIIIIVRAKGNF